MTSRGRAAEMECFRLRATSRQHGALNRPGACAPRRTSSACIMGVLVGIPGTTRKPRAPVSLLLRGRTAGVGDRLTQLPLLAASGRPRRQRGGSAWRTTSYVRAGRMFGGGKQASWWRRRWRCCREQGPRWRGGERGIDSGWLEGGCAVTGAGELVGTCGRWRLTRATRSSRTTSSPCWIMKMENPCSWPLGRTVREDPRQGACVVAGGPQVLAVIEVAACPRAAAQARAVARRCRPGRVRSRTWVRGRSSSREHLRPAAFFLGRWSRPSAGPPSFARLRAALPGLDCRLGEGPGGACWPGRVEGAVVAGMGRP